MPNPKNSTTSLRKDDTSQTVDDFAIKDDQVYGSNLDDDDDTQSPAISTDEESARDDYLNKLGKHVDAVLDELEAELDSSDSIFVDPEKVTETIETLNELMHIRAEQLAEPELPHHVDERVEDER